LILSFADHKQDYHNSIEDKELHVSEADGSWRNINSPKGRTKNPVSLGDSYERDDTGMVIGHSQCSKTHLLFVAYGICQMHGAASRLNRFPPIKPSQPSPIPGNRFSCSSNGARRIVRNLFSFWIHRHSPYEFLFVFADEIKKSYNYSVWSFRDLVRDVELVGSVLLYVYSS
jgi:hypothetical protein